MAFFQTADERTRPWQSYVDGVDPEEQEEAVATASCGGSVGESSAILLRQRREARSDGASRGGDAAFLLEGQIEESLGRFCDFRIVDNAIQNAARIAREIVSFRHPKISAVKLAVADPNAELLRGDMTADEMREIIRRKLVDEGLLPPTEIDHQGLVRDGDEQRRRGR